ncbi:M15 family metallopeptidase [Xanthomonas melonis]|nr:M15 family metallopeptidase [Xanthomonas melonis]MCC4601078.1 M15 family metallopeptidase [Xanthomonas melonis]
MTDIHASHRVSRCPRQRLRLRRWRLAAAAAACVCGSAIPGPVVSPATTAAQAGLIDVATLAPDIAVDMRYARSDNFTGQVVPGYDAARCYLLRPAADALARVALTLKTQGYQLQVFDCYRPVRAVRAFVAWAADLQDQSTKARYYPRVDKRALLGDYIADTSGHSRGATLDVGLLDCRQTPCRAVDMGTGFDFFDPRAHTDAPDLDAGQRANRQRLVRAMAAQGFANYPMEWWHFTLTPEPTPHTAYDVPVE